MPESFTSLVTGSFSFATTAYEISVCASSVSSIQLSLTLKKNGSLNAMLVI